jgi:AraC family transcriptional activator of pobA
MNAIRTSRHGAEGPAAIPAFFLYGEPLRITDERTVHVETIAARSRLHKWRIKPHRHRDLHQALFLQRGYVEASLDDLSTSLGAPAVVMVPPGSVHSFSFQEGTVGLVVSFGIDLAHELSSSMRGSLEFLERPVALPLERSSVKATDLAQLSGMLLREFSRSAQGRDIAMSGLLAALLANLLRLTRTAAMDIEGASTPEREIVARYRQLIEHRYREHAAISDYARELGTSENRLRKACLAVAGQSPVRIVHQRLLVEAERQLRYTSMSVTQVAYFLGFEDPAYFSRFFTRAMRLSPRSFRNRNYQV